MNSPKKTKKQLLEEIEDLKDKLFEYDKIVKEKEYDRKRLNHLASFPELNPNPIIEIDEAKKITYCNEASLELFRKLNLPADLYLFLPDDIDLMIQEICNGNDNSYTREKIINNHIFEEHIYLTSKLKTIRIYILDVTKIRTAEKELLKTKQLLEKIAKTSPAIISVYDINTERNIYQNRSLLHTLGYTINEIDELINKPSDNFKNSIHSEDLPQIEKFYDELENMKDGQNYEMEFRILDNEKKWKWIRRVYSVFSRDENGYPSQLVSIFENINDRKSAEEKLKKSESSLLEAHKLAKLGHFEYDVLTKEVTWSAETFKIIGCEHLTKAPSFEQYWSYIHPDDVELVRSTNFNAIKDKKPYNYEYRVMYKNKSIKYIKSVGRPICDNEGNVVKIFGTIIDITESKKFDESNRINAERFRVALQNSPIIVFNQDINLKYTWIHNPAGGYKPHELIGKTDYDLVPFEEAEELSGIKRNVIETGKATRAEMWLHIGSTYNCYELTVEPLFDSKKNVIGITCSTFDVSERKKYELILKKNETRFRSIFENANDIITYIDRSGKIIEVNKKVEDILGYSRSELIGKNFFSLKLFPTPVLKRLVKEFEKVSDKGAAINDPEEKGYITMEIMVKRKDNSSAIIETNTTVIKEDGEIQGFLSIIRDITEKKAYIEALRESEETSRALLNTISETVLMHDRNGVVIALNDTAAKRIGKTKDELLGKNLYDVFPENLAKSRKERVLKAINSQKPEKHYDSRNGFHYDTTIYPVVDAKGKVNKVIIFSKDITEAKNAEEVIRESEERYRNLIESSPEAIIVHSEGKIIFANEATADLLKASSPEDLLGKKVKQFLHPGYQDNEKQRLRDIAKNVKNVPALEEKFICLDGSVIDVEVSAIPITIKGKNAVQIIANDITERKMVLNFLRESELKYKTLFESANDAIFLLEDDQYIDCNTKALKMYSCERHDIIEKSPYHFSPPTQPDGSNSKEKVIDVLKRAHKGEALFYEWKHIDKNGKPFDAEVSLNRFEIGGKPYLQKIVRDITGRKASEKALRETKLLLEKIAATSPTIITVYDVNSNKNIYQNKSLLESLGYKIEHLKDDFDRNSLIHEDDLIILEEEYKKTPLMIEGMSYSVEYRIKDVNNKWNWIRKVYSVFQRDEKGKIEQVVSIFENITDRKESEIALKLSEEFNRAINENSPLGISVRSRKGKLITCNNAWKNILEKTDEDVLIDKTKERKEFSFDKKDDYLIHWKDDIENIYKTGGTLYIPELKIITNRTKKLKWISNYFYAIKDNEGQVDRVIIITDDITERKLAEEALIESQRKLITLMGNLPGIAYRCKNDEYWSMEFVSERCLELTGYKAQELINNSLVSFSSIIHPDDREMILNKINEALDNKTSFEIIYRIITKQKKEKWVWEKGQGVYSKAGEILALEGFITNITERKKAEEQLRKLYQGVQQSPAAIIVTDLKGNIEYVNPSFTKVTGYSAEEVIGNNPRLLKSGFTKDEEYKAMWQTIINGHEWKGEFYNKKKNGELFWESASISPIKDENGITSHFLAVKEDITEQKRKDEKILNSLKEKEVMLREIHHRVKNNLQIISSLLKLQSGYIKDPISYDYFTISQNRVKSMALIHQQLYRSTDLSKINFGEYIQKLSNHLMIAYGISKDKIKIDINAHDIFLEIDTAIPCGLLINELISNAFKHAFPDDRNGSICINMDLDENNFYTITVKDDGVGMPENFNWRNTTSLGMQLVITLTEQLDGKIEALVRNGSEFTIKFSKPNYIKRV